MNTPRQDTAMPEPDDTEAIEALIKRLSDEKKAQADLVRKQRDIITQYLILDIEDYLAEAREQREEAAEAFDPAKEMQRSPLSKWSEVHCGLYDGVSIMKIIRHQMHCLWEQWATNPYSLHASWYGMIMMLLWVWLVGTVVCGYYEARHETGSERLAKLCRGILGAIPPIVQFLLFLFPPLFVQF